MARKLSARGVVSACKQPLWTIHSFGQRCRNGITLAEILILIAVMAILLCMFLPLLNVAPRASRRNGCINQARQLGLGILNHESATRHFPLANDGDPPASGLGAVAPGANSESARDGCSWIVKILPYLEETKLYDQISTATSGWTVAPFDSSVRIPGHDHPGQVRLRLLICPNYSGQTTVAGKYSTPRLAVTNYYALHALVSDKQIVIDDDPRLGGVLVTKQASTSGLSMGDLKDGTSQTILLCEGKGELYNAWFSGQSAWVVGLQPDQVHGVKANSDDGFNSPSTDSGSLMGRTATALNFGRDYRTPKDDAQPWYHKNFIGGPRDWGPSSNHAGGVVVHTFVDVHTKALSSDIDETVYFRLLTRAGGEPVGGDY